MALRRGVLREGVAYGGGARGEASDGRGGALRTVRTQQIRGGALGGEDEGVALGMAWCGLSAETAVVLCLPFEG